jgi:hypothetical protein
MKMILWSENLKGREHLKDFKCREDGTVRMDLRERG